MTDSLTDDNMKKPKPNWERFGMQIMRNWPQGDVDGGDLQELAIENNIILLIPGGFDPEVHDSEYSDFYEPGDQWFERNYHEGQLER